MTALAKIKAAGFALSLTDTGGIYVAPFSKLTPNQRDYLKAHKAEIIVELEGEAAKPAKPYQKHTECVYPKPVTVWTPAGEPMHVMVKDAAHEQFLITKNPKPPAVSVTVSDVLTVYDIKKRRKDEAPDGTTQTNQTPAQGAYLPPANYGKPHARPYDDELTF